MSDLLSRLLAERRVLLADGATGTNYFDMGLASGEAPEAWLTEHPEKVAELHRRFVEAGADIILTNSFGANRYRLKLHGLQDRTHELNRLAASLARKVADAAGRPVVTAGSMGPTGELFTPLGALTMDAAIEAFAEQARGLKEGGADVAWIETMSAPEELEAAARGAIAAGLPYVFTASFDTAGRTMMGLTPEGLTELVERLVVKPVAYGANCGIGPGDLVASVLSMSEAAPGDVLVAKGNCGIPQWVGDSVHYGGTPELMGHYACLARAAGARIIGGCCGTSPAHIAAMRKAIDAGASLPRPTFEAVEATLGPITRSKQSAGRARTGRRGREVA
ncbi:betaine--homocysteine S-methyltransferase [Alsobacter sp. SYSU M60028]|uniref:Betaine--homocysteine S-methyltransferase n=1 Tax=Alsobacter ponti TaxID=2962936 RepID=A0ABT1LHK4_9HYPH|nr:betaine--homocysteine S-methyltransferase [Alsobacter ponti]